MLVKRKKFVIYNKCKIIFNPFLKDNISNPCSQCILRDYAYELKYGFSGCSILLKKRFRKYFELCRKYDMLNYYYIPNKICY